MPSEVAPPAEDQAVEAPSDQRVALVDEYLRAFNEYDQDAFRAAVDDDYRFVLPEVTFSADTTAGLFEDHRRQNWAVEPINSYTLRRNRP